MIFKDSKTYDRLKLCALLIIPVATFVSQFCEIWGIPYGAQIQATLIALDVLVGAVVTKSADAFKKAHLPE